MLAVLIPTGTAIAQTAVNNIPATDTNTNTLPPVVNIIIGGGTSACSSYNGPDDPKRCTKPWSEIVRLDPAFADMRLDQISFERSITLPTFTYQIDESKIAAMNAMPTTLLSEQTKRSVTSRLRAALDAQAKVTAVDASKPVALAATRSPTPPTAPSATAVPTLSGLSAADFLSLTGISTSLSKGASADSMNEQAVVRHVFVENPTGANATPRQVQARSVLFQKDDFTPQIYQSFVAAASAVAGGKKPTIGLVTASAENPFYDRDINYFALKSAGANVVWLPIEGGLRKAIDNKDCEHAALYYAGFASTASVNPHFHMDQVFPDLAQQQRAFCANNSAQLNASLNSIDGIFFTGGNQARILESFITRDANNAYTQLSEQLKILLARHTAGQLVVAGSSAGDAIQAGGKWKDHVVPMISGGDPWRTLVNGFTVSKSVMVDDPETDRMMKGGSLFSNGGLGFFHYGALDSHFSNRAREGRLVRLVKDSQLDYGFGVDENTALIVRQPDAQGVTTMSVVGAAGVFVVDVRQTPATTATSKTRGSYQISNARIHYLTAGDTLTIGRAGELRVALANDKQSLTANASAAPAVQTRIMEPGKLNFLKLTQQMGRSGASIAFGSSTETKGQDAPLFGATLKRDSNTSFRVDEKGRVSYTNLLLTLAACDGACAVAE